MKTAHRIAKNTLSLFVSGLMAPAIAMVAVIYLARVLGPGDFGAVNFAIALTTYFTIFTDMGLGLYGTRELSRDRENLCEYLGDMLGLRVFLSAVSFSLLLLFVLMLNKPHEIKMLVVVFGLGLFPSAFLLEWAYQGIERMEYIGISRILMKAIFAALVVLFVRKHEQLILVPWFQLVVTITITAIFFFIFVRKFGAPRFRLNVREWGGMLKGALPLGISVVLIQVITNLGTVMLGFMKDDEQVGYFNAAYKIIFPVVMAAASYFDAIFPVLSNYCQTSLEKLEKIQKYTARIMVSVAVPCAVGGMLTAGPIVRLFYGPAYEPAVAVFRVLACVAAVICINMIYARGLWACNQQGVYLKIVLVQAALNLAVNLALIPRWGVVGAALGTLSAELLGLTLYGRAFKRIINVRFVPFLGRPLLAALVMAFYLVSLRQMDVYVLLIGGALVYGIFLFFAKGITREDLAGVRGMFF